MNADQLARDLLSDNPASRVAAADRLATLGEEAQPATCALVEACADPALRDLCVGALEELGEPPAAALPRLAELLRSPDELVAYWAATLLGRAGPAATNHRADLERVVVDTNRPKHVQDRASWALRKIS